jgi:hypothetical protein
MTSCRTALFWTILLPFASLAQAVTVVDPLDPQFKPFIDTHPADYPSNIWITGSLAKVLQNTGAPGTDHWAILYAAQNETQSFQVHVQAVNRISALNVKVSDFVNLQTGTKILASSTDIVVYAERYMNVWIKTNVNSTFLNTTGYIPDILVPAIDPYYHQVTNAFPMAVAAGNNQSVWVDVHVPPAAPSGYYSSSVTVSDGATVLTKMPVIYAVWNWQTPSTSSLPSMVSMGYGGFCTQVYGSIAGCSAYPGSLNTSDYGVTMAQVDGMVQMLDNRYTASATNVFLNPTTWDFTTFDKVYSPIFNGTPGHVTGILQGAKATSYALSLLSGTQAAGTKAFQEHFASKGWPLMNFLCDEPPAGCGSWANLVADGNLEHTYSAPIVPNISTTDIVNAGNNGALNTIDILIPNIATLEPQVGPMQSLAAYQEWLAAGSQRQFWSYGSCSSVDTCSDGRTGPLDGPPYTGTYPNYAIDGKPVANRIMEWLTYLHGQTGELYYSLDVCWAGGDAHNCLLQGQTTNPNPNPIQSVYYSGGWGDGDLLYPGSTAYVGTPIPIWLPSMRLKMIRDGMQDYEYLHALTNLGYGSLATQEAKSFITNSYTFNNDPVVFEAARAALGTKLHQLGVGSLAPTLSTLSPSSGPEGTRVNVTGTNFTSAANAVSAANTVEFGTAKITHVSSSNGTSLSFVVPRQATPGQYNVSVSNANGTSNSLNFTVIISPPW